MTHHIDTADRRRRPNGNVARLLTILALAAPTAGAQHTASTAACGGFCNLNNPDYNDTISDTEPLSDISLVAAQGHCGTASMRMVSRFDGDVSVPFTNVAYSLDKQCDNGALKAHGRFITSIIADDLVFTRFAGGGGTVSVTLPAAVHITSDEGDPDKPDDGLIDLTIIGDDPLSSTDFLANAVWTQNAGNYPPNGTWDLTTTRPDVTLGQTYSMDLRIWAHFAAPRANGPLLGDTFATVQLRLGDPSTGALFDLPQGITANAPSIGLVNNHFVGTRPSIQGQPPTVSGGGAPRDGTGSGTKAGGAQRGSGAPALDSGEAASTAGPPHCQRSVGFGTDGVSLAICGDVLTEAGSVATVAVTGAEPGAPVLLFAGEHRSPERLFDGWLVPGGSARLLGTFTADSLGEVRFPIEGGHRDPRTVFVQAVVGGPSGWELTNAVELTRGTP